MKSKEDPKPSHTPAGYSRLHITPLDPSLLQVIVPAAVLPNARHVSYHTLQTFPERPYGFVDLPSADADKIRKKLNGAILRGTKIRIEPARPDNMPQPSPDTVMDDAVAAKSNKSKADKKEKKDKKRKRDPQEVTGIELEDGRKVKRGWTVTPDEALAKKEKEKKEERKLRKPKKMDKDTGKDKEKKKKRRRKEPESLYSEVPECLVKTRLPPNKLDLADGKKSKRAKKRDTVVHEFEKNTKFATFLKATQTADSAAGEETTFFVEGKGWMTKDGKVVEEVKSTRPKTFPRLQVGKSSSSGPETTAEDEDNDTTSSSDSNSDSGSSSENESQSQSTPAKQLSINTRPTAAVSAPEPGSARPQSAASLGSLTIKIPPSTPTPASTKVHPLEALYKKQNEDEVSKSNKPTEAEPFSFFGGQQEEEEDEDNIDEAENLEPAHGSQMPMTPFTKQDFEWRNTRSAAPTPDTAHPSRISRIWPMRGDEDYALDDVQEDTGEDEGDGDDATADYGAAQGSNNAVDGATNPNTDFEKWFWEHRGDLNRSWKRRRKLAAKEKRYRENKARANRAI